MFTISNKILSKAKTLLPQKILSIVFSLGLVALTFAGIGFKAMPQAQALTLKTTPIIVANSNPVDEVFGSGTSDQIEGKAKEDIGKVERNLGKAKEDIQGGLKQAEGRAQQDTGKVKNRMEDAGSDLEEASDKLGDAINSLFGK